MISDFNGSVEKYEEIDKHFEENKEKADALQKDRFIEFH